MHAHDVLGELGHHVSGAWHGIDFVVQKLFLIQHVQISQHFFVLRRCRHKTKGLGILVIVHQSMGDIPSGSKIKQAHHGGNQMRRAEGQRNLIRGVPVPVGVLFLERPEHFREFVQRLRIGKIQIFQPVLIDVHFHDSHIITHFQRGHTVDMPIRHGNSPPNLRIFLHELFEIVAVLVNQIIQCQKDSLTSVSGQIRIGKTQSKEYIRQRVGGHHCALPLL